MSNTRKTSRDSSGKFASDAAKAEAKVSELVIEHGGKTYVIPPTNQWPIDVFEAAEDGKAIRALRGVLGPKQWQAYKDTSPDFDDLNAFFDKLAEAGGLSSAGG